MKYLYLFLLSLAMLPAWGQQEGISFRGVGGVSYQELAAYGHFYAIKKAYAEEAPRGEIVFTPGGDLWNYSWTYKGVPQPVEPYDDSTYYAFPIQGDGEYVLTATKEGADPVERRLTLFHDYFSFSTSLSNELDCEYITINIAYDEIPKYGNFEGWGNVHYWVDWGSHERELSSMEDYIYKEIAQSVIGESRDVDYKVRIRDRFGFEWESKEGTYTSVIPKAEFEIELGNTVSVVGEVHGEMGQAPLEVAFHNESENAEDYEWLLYRDTAEMTFPAVEWTDSLIDNQVITSFEPPLKTYAHPGHYKVILIAENAVSGCRDTSDIEYVHVVESLLEVPNVFTPNGDGKNDVFMVRALSIESFHGVILNRWGRQIYEWRDQNEGWDGRIHGKLANPGTYYYVITARGRERIDPPRYIKKGALMLIR